MLSCSSVLYSSMIIESTLAMIEALSCAATWVIVVVSVATTVIFCLLDCRVLQDIKRLIIKTIDIIFKIIFFDFSFVIFVDFCVKRDDS